MELQKIEYLENEKSLLDEIKNKKGLIKNSGCNLFFMFLTSTSSADVGYVRDVWYRS